MIPKPEYLSYDQLRGSASAFLDEFWPTGAVPVDVEHIADVGFGIDIIPVEHLRDLADVDGFITAAADQVFVDSGIYNHGKLYRYRFTIAHELAHAYLHSQLLGAARYESVEEWLAFQDEIPEESRKWFEWQAYSFAGLVLAPPEALASRIREAVERAAALGMTVDLEEEATREYLAEWVGRRFEVSGDVILRRGKHDGHWSRY